VTGLLLEDLKHGFAFGLIDLGESLFDEGTVFKAAGVEHFSEAERRMAQKNFSVFETLVVICDREMHFVSNHLDLFEHVVGFVDVAGGILAQAQFRHLVDQFGVEETLFARLSLGDFALECRDTLLVRGFFVRGIGASGQCYDREENNERQGQVSTHGNLRWSGNLERITWDVSRSTPQCRNNRSNLGEEASKKAGLYGYEQAPVENGE